MRRGGGRQGLCAFDYSAQPGLDRRLIEELATGRFLYEGRNLVLLGPPGVGKTHLAIGLGVMTAELGHRVYFTSAMDLARKLTAAMEQNRLHRQLCALTQPKLLILDEVGYLTLDATQASLLFQVICRRYDNCCLYVILDVFSRYVVGWCVEYRESAEIAEQLILHASLKQGIERGQLTIHADRGNAMTSKCVAQLLSDLGVQKTHSRPHVSNDNPHSEAQFKTVKYRPNFPRQFGFIRDTRRFCCEFFDWYNDEHRHSGIAMLTPATVHYGNAEQEIAKRQSVLEAAYAANPQHFVRHAPI